MQVAIRAELPSLEAKMVFKHFGAEAEGFLPWGYDALCRRFDLAICIGPVKWCPPADKKLLLVLGPVSIHHDLGWDAVVVTSRKAVALAKTAFGWGIRVFMLPPPLLALENGSRWAVEPEMVGLHASPCPWVLPANVAKFRMCLWGGYESINPLFSARRFNALARNGAFGIYTNMTDGYDVQVRRHLALGSPVICSRDPEVLGELTDLCVDKPDEIRRIEPVPDKVTELEYLDMLSRIVETLGVN